MKYICGLDIGSSKIAACLGCYKGSELSQIWRTCAVVSGIKHGQVQDIHNLTAALWQALKTLKAKSGVKIKSVYLGIASQNIVVKRSQAVIALAERGNKSITKTDVQRVIKQAQILSSSLEDEIIYFQPLSYTVDSDNNVTNPIGLYGHRLRVDLYLISVRASYLNTIIEAIGNLGLKTNDVTLSGLATSQAVFSYNQLKGVNILCDIGKDTTQILIFSDHRLVHYQIINCGGNDLTASLSKELNLPYPLAEEVKISYGRVQNNPESADKEIIVKKGNAYSTLSQNQVIQIIWPAAGKIVALIRDIIKPHILAISSPFPPAEITLYVGGRTACLDGFLELLEVEMQMPVKIAKIGNPSLLTPLLHHSRLISGEGVLNYLTCLGLIAQPIKPLTKGFINSDRGISALSSIPERIKEIYQRYF